MRTNKKHQLLTFAIAIVEAKGLDALTYDSLAQASGFSKSGLIYHFPSRDALLLDINTHLAQCWEEEMIAYAGGRAEEVSFHTRVHACFSTMSASATRAELRMSLDAATNPALSSPWLDVFDRWGVPIKMVEENPDLYLFQILADGLWVHDHINGVKLSPTQRTQLIERALAIFDEYIEPKTKEKS
ncbi:MAG: TetR family transcriptional regulator [Corynebacterium sp.]|uniref:TetR/AcrR family transcriptional regulator n=1 Tax=Corynebacterium sp. TaxID=1720 RepID=UPI0026DAD91D|nr:TetR family transcriptional regulator [Corynebacterium sp.]MDO4761034.1 TetR family transcriptional regulator [Corynebacterium sp.]